MARIPQTRAKRLLADEHALKGSGRPQTGNGTLLAITPTVQPRSGSLRRHCPDFHIVNYNRGVALKLAVVENHRRQGLHLGQKRKIVGRRVRDDGGIKRWRTAQGTNTR